MNINNTKVMDIQILISKKGTAVVIASHLHRALGLKDEYFGTHCKKWLQDLYQFNDDIRKPSKMKDFAERKLKESIIPDYYLGIEFAKLIALRSSSKEKKKVVLFLNAFQKKQQKHNELSKEQVELAFELAQSMTSMKAQLEAEQKFMAIFISKQGHSKLEWNQHHKELLGYDKLDLQDRLMSTGQFPGKKTKRELLMKVDKYELVRMGVIDLLKSMNKTDVFARKMGDLAYFFANKLKLEINNDLDPTVLQFKPSHQNITPDMLVMDYFENKDYSA